MNEGAERVKVAMQEKIDDLENELANLRRQLLGKRGRDDSREEDYYDEDYGDSSDGEVRPAKRHHYE